MSKKVLITEPIVEDAITKLRDHFQVTVKERGTYEQEEKLARDIQHYDALFSMLSTPVTKKVVEAGKNLQIIANYAVGYDNIAIDSAKKHNIRVANTPDVLTNSSADGAFALLLATARKVCEAQNLLRSGYFDGWHPTTFLGTELHGKTLGIVGMGKIGGAVAKRALGFGMNICYHNRNRVDEAKEEQLEATYIPDIKQLAKKADIISLNCPLTEETYHLIDAELLNTMGADTLIINTARGAVIDEAALAEALQTGRIAGAGLDVFEEEPKIHPELLNAPNTVLLPHIASATHEARTKMGLLAADAIIAVLKNRDTSKLTNLVC